MYSLTFHISDVKSARMKNLAGNIVDANTTTVQVLMDTAATRLRNKTHWTNRTQLTYMLEDDSGEYSYPIATFTYLIIELTGMEDCNKAIELCRYDHLHFPNILEPLLLPFIGFQCHLLFCVRSDENKAKPFGFQVQGVK